jgi:broad specificity phosphatase PhoE
MLISVVDNRPYISTIDTMASGTSPNDGLVTTIASASLFVTTALLSYWIQNNQRILSLVSDECRAFLVPRTSHLPAHSDEDYYESLLDEDEEELQKDSNHWYSLRRLEDRMSFHNLTEGNGSADQYEDDQVADIEGGEFANNPPVAESCFIADFCPRNKNWNHFEKSRNVAKGSAGVPGVYRAIEGDDGDDEDAGFSTSSSDHFVWTDARKILRPTRRYVSVNDLAVESSQLEDHIPPIALHRAVSLDDRAVFCSQERLHAAKVDAVPERNTASTLAPSIRRAISHSDMSSNPSLASLHARRAMDQTDRTLSNHVRHQNRVARAHYNARIMPNTLTLIRHGQSMGNVDEHLYSTTSDNAMPLTKLGWEQARQAGRSLKERILKNSTQGGVHFIVSPYVRAVETFHGIASAWCDPSDFNHITDRDQRLRAWYGRLLELGLTWHEDPRIREQDFGNYQEPAKIKEAKADRHRFGAFYYRFPHGESASDVFDRISTFLDSLWRSFDMNKSRHYVLVTHGVSIRVLLSRYFRYTIDQFHSLANPRNCEMIMLGHDGMGRLQLSGRYELEMKQDETTTEMNTVGYKFYRRLRVLPDEYIRKVKIRISYDDE